MYPLNQHILEPVLFQYRLSLTGYTLMANSAKDSNWISSGSFTRDHGTKEIVNALPEIESETSWPGIQSLKQMKIQVNKIVRSSSRMQHITLLYIVPRQNLLVYAVNRDAATIYPWHSKFQYLPFELLYLTPKIDDQELFVILLRHKFQCYSKINGNPQ